MGKRIVTKIGNIFSAKVDNEYKFYFQYVANDLTELNSSVIRVFKRRHPLESNPKMDDIASDEVLFYAHTILRNGIELGIWEKVGKSAILGLDDLDKVWFGLAQKISFNRETMEVYDCNPAENLWIWHVNQDIIEIGCFKKGMELYVEPGEVFTPDGIVERFKFGHYLGTNGIYYHIKRKPWDDVDTYTKGINGDSNERVYFHFLGEHVVQQVVITPDGRKYRLDKAHPREGEYKLLEDDFGDIFWEHKDFITPEEFYAVWD